MRFVGKIIILTFKDTEEKAVERAIAAGALCYLAASPGRVFTKAQIFEAVWSMGSESCQSNVANVICNLRKKIEPDSQNPTYIKTVLGIGYKFASGEWNHIGYDMGNISFCIKRGRD